MITFAFTGTTYQTDRIIGDLQGDKQGPTAVFIGGIHGNEPSGVIAIQNVIQDLQQRNVPIHGRILGIVGNMSALAESARFLNKDLNRLWDQKFFRHYTSGHRFEDSEINEYREACEVFSIISPLLMAEAAEKQVAAFSNQIHPVHGLCFFDLHTTSSKSPPFVAINDQLDNRSFALQFPVPTVLGIEEFLHGPLLSYINDFGPVAFTFEAGKHDDQKSVELHEAFIYQALIKAGCLQATDVPHVLPFQAWLDEQFENRRGIYEVIYRHPVSPQDQFQMNGHFENFTPVKKGQPLAKDRRGDILAPYSGYIFMPLYQSMGEDGFFIVRQIPKIALTLSSYLRRRNFERFLVWLPGISRSSDEPDAFIVNHGIARFLSTQLFHLLGYRRKRTVGNLTTFVRREVGFIPH